MQTTYTHSKAVGYVLWIFGFTGSHRFYYGKPVTASDILVRMSVRSKQANELLNLVTAATRK